VILPFLGRSRILVFENIHNLFTTPVLAEVVQSGRKHGSPGGSPLYRWWIGLGGAIGRGRLRQAQRR